MNESHALDSTRARVSSKKLNNSLNQIFLVLIAFALRTSLRTQSRFTKEILSRRDEARRSTPKVLAQTRRKKDLTERLIRLDHGAG